jgi:cholesterol transport system auxiliary component
LLRALSDRLNKKELLYIASAPITQYSISDMALDTELYFRTGGGSSNRVISTKKITVREPMQKKNPEAGAAAANGAIAKALQEVAGFVLEKIS